MSFPSISEINNNIANAPSDELYKHAYIKRIEEEQKTEDELEFQKQNLKVKNHLAYVRKFLNKYKRFPKTIKKYTFLVCELYFKLFDEYCSKDDPDHLYFLYHKYENGECYFDPSFDDIKFFFKEAKPNASYIFEHEHSEYNIREMKKGYEKEEINKLFIECNKFLNIIKMKM
jgi:hypothetical protein